MARKPCNPLPRKDCSIRVVFDERPEVNDIHLLALIKCGTGIPYRHRAAYLARLHARYPHMNTETKRELEMYLLQYASKEEKSLFAGSVPCTDSQAAAADDLSEMSSH